MKKVWVLGLFFAVLVGNFLFAQGVDPLTSAPPPDYKPLVFSDEPGSFAIYRVSRAGPASYVGWCAMGGNQLALRYYEPDTQTELLVLQTYYTVASAMEPGSIDLVRGDFDRNDAATRLFPVVYACADAMLFSRREAAGLATYESTNNGVFDFSAEVPVFHLDKAQFSVQGKTGPADVSLELVSSGVADSAMDPSFFGYTGEKEGR